MSEVEQKDIPENWVWSTLGEVFDWGSGGTPKRTNPAYYDGDIPWLIIRDLNDGPVGDSATKINEEGLKNSSAKWVEPGSVLVAMYGSIGKLGLATERLTTNQAIAFTQPEPNDAKYLFYYLMLSRNALARQGKGIAQKNISQTVLKAFPFPLAPLDQQKRIVAKIEELFSHIDAGIEALKKAKQLLKQYRQSVLKAAVTGELTKDLPSRQAGWRDPTFRNISGKRVPESSDKYFAYILECEDGSLYKGFSKDLFQRIDQHLAGQGAKWTKEHKPVSIIHFEEFDTEKEAVEREKYFKSGSGREWINQIREEQNKKYEPASQLLERILKERREKWEEQQLEQFKAKGKMPKDDKWKDQYKYFPLPDTEGLPSIPEVWKWVNLQHVFDVITDGDHQAPPKSDVGIPFLVIGNVNKGVLDFSNTRFVPKSYFDSLSEIRIPRRGDILYTVVGSYGIPVKVDTDKEFCVQRHVAILKPSKEVSVEYIYHILPSGFVFKQATDASTGTAQKTVPLGGLREIKIPLPPFEEQKEIARIIDEKLIAMNRLADESENKMMVAEKNKQSILASIFSGKL